MTLTDDDLRHLRRCVDLAREALEAGDDPFGSRAGRRPTARSGARSATGPATATRPSIRSSTLARWSATLSPEERAASTVYTSGEHCPMCSAAHAWMGLGRLVYAVSATQLVGGGRGGDCPRAGAGAVGETGRARVSRWTGRPPELADEMRALHRRAATRP